ncbi:MAG: hypothetical protein H6766_03940 [Candidatus Peribacteria bacterium]|nr:MAG: hypothetical protein H6766_03940 [Candidatus Peribacteria bacterium]
MVPKIIEHMKQTGERGEFFHPSLSPFGYNETVAAEYYPVQKAESGKLEAVSSDGKALGLELSAYGYKRSDYEAPQPQVDKIIPGEKLPDYGCATIQEKKPEFLSDILRYAIRCEVSGKLFRLIPQEIEFYKKHNLSLPRKHPDVRHAERMEMRK